jgi:hypothetical protein
MQRTWHLTTGLIFLVTFSACGGTGGVTPIGPSAAGPPPTPPSPVTQGQGHGTITIREFSPRSGATLAVHDGCGSGRVTHRCADNWRGTLDVVVDREMTYPVLVVRFYDGARLCGYGANTRNVVPADTSVSFDVSLIWLSDEFGTFTQPCQLPATTTRMVAELWSDSSSWSNTLIQELPAATYTFAER